jgi:hypothetical protein
LINYTHISQSDYGLVISCFYCNAENGLVIEDKNKFSDMVRHLKRFGLFEKNELGAKEMKELGEIIKKYKDILNVGVLKEKKLE